VPIYDYRCDHCGHVFSAVQSFKDEALAECPRCGKRPRRLITTPAIVFKGPGWYKTDSRGPSSSGGKDGEGGKPESKPDAAPRSESTTKSDKAAPGEAAS